MMWSNFATRCRSRDLPFFLRLVPRLRRYALSWCGSLVAVSVLAAPQSDTHIPVSIRSASEVRDGWGVCGRPGIDAGIDAFAMMMASMGTRNLRSPLAQGGSSMQPQFEALRRAMMRTGNPDLSPRLNVLISAYLNDSTTWLEQQAQILALARTGLLRAIEGPNEINNPMAGGGAHGPADHADRTGSLSFPDNYLDWAQAIHRFAEANRPALHGVTIVAPSIASGDRADYAALPSVSALVDAGNVHFYAGSGRQPSFSLATANPQVGSFTAVAAWAQVAQKPSGPVWLTETGATTSGNYAFSGRSQAKYLANQLFDYFAAGGQRLYFYQLIDANGQSGDTEGNFGLFRHQGTAKPAAKMLSNLSRLLAPSRARRGRVDVAGNGAVTLVVPPGATGPAGPQALVLSQPDGSAIVAVWNESPIDDGAGHDIEPAPQPVTLSFGSARSFSVHDLLGPHPLQGSTPTGKPSDTGEGVALQLRGSPLLVKLAPR